MVDHSLADANGNPQDALLANTETHPGVIYPSFGGPDGTVLYRPPWLEDVSASPPLPTLPAEITVEIPPAVVHQLFAHRQWRAGIMLADAIAHGEIEVKGKRVLELGAGTALPGIVASLAGARSTVITDYNTPELVRRMRDNMNRNIPAYIRDERGRVVVMGHTWGMDVEDLLWDSASRSEVKFDVILCADVFWDTFSHDVLLQTITKVLAQDGVVHIAAGSHTGRHVVGRFFRKAEAVGLHLHGVGGEAVYEWEFMKDDAADAATDQAIITIRSDLSGNKRDFDEKLVEDVKARNGWMVRCTLKRS
jgi:nicotinamide N-methyltransferase